MQILEINLPNKKLDLLPLEMTIDVIYNRRFLNIHFWVFDYVSYVRSALFDYWFYAQRLKGGLTSTQIANYKNRSHYFKTDSRKHAKFTITFANTVFQLTSDQQGHACARIELAWPYNMIGPTWSISLLFRGQYRQVDVTINQLTLLTRFVTGSFLLNSSKTRRLLISDIDDTVKITGVTDKSEMLENTFFNDFIEVPGMGFKYASLVATQLVDHIYYVSSSPWQLFPSLSHFLETRQFPQTGNLSLRKLVANEIHTLCHFATNSFEYKIETIQRIIQKHLNYSCTNTNTYTSFPTYSNYGENLEVILVGDAGEKDPEIYNQIALMYPNLVKKIVIRTLDDYCCPLVSIPNWLKIGEKSIISRFSPTVYPLVSTYTSGYDFSI